MNAIELSKTVNISAGGINYRGALVQADYYRIYYNSTYGGLSLQAINNGYVVFTCTLKMSRKRAESLADTARNAISNVFNPLKDLDK